MEQDCRSGIFEIEKFDHGVLVSGNTIADLDIGIVTVDPGIRELAHEDSHFFSTLEKHTDNSLS